MKPSKHLPKQPDHATMRLCLDVDRVPGDRVAVLVQALARACHGQAAVTGMSFEPVALELTGPRAVLEALRTSVLRDEDVRQALGTSRLSVGQVSVGSRPGAARGRRVLVVDGDAGRARDTVDALARAGIEGCAVTGLEPALVMMQGAALRLDAVVLRHALADGDGLALLERVGLEERRGSVLVLDDQPCAERARAYRQRGAFRYGGAPANTQQLVSLVNAAMLDTQAWRQAEDPGEPQGEPPRQLLDPELGADRLRHLCRLSPTERNVAAMVLIGLRDLEIAERLAQSERTAKRYVGKVLEKAGISNRSSLWGVLHKDGLGGSWRWRPDAERRAPSARPPGASPAPVGLRTPDPSPSRPSSSWA